MADQLRLNFEKFKKDLTLPFEEWPEEVQILGCKEKSAIKNGQTDIYPAWKSLLSAWLSKNWCEVYLATPFIDTKRMIDICNIVIEQKSTANIKTFFCT